MSYERVKQANKIVVGAKQTVKAIRNGIVTEVIIATDAEKRITTPVMEEAESNHLIITYVDSKKCLGAACGIDVHTTVVAITV